MAVVTKYLNKLFFPSKRLTFKFSVKYKIFKVREKSLAKQKQQNEKYSLKKMFEALKRSLKQLRHQFKS